MSTFLSPCLCWLANQHIFKLIRAHYSISHIMFLRFQTGLYTGLSGDIYCFRLFWGYTVILEEQESAAETPTERILEPGENVEAFSMGSRLLRFVHSFGHKALAKIGADSANTGITLFDVAVSKVGGMQSYPFFNKILSLYFVHDPPNCADNFEAFHFIRLITDTSLV